MDYQCYTYCPSGAERLPYHILDAQEQMLPPIKRWARLLLRQELAARLGKAPQEIQFFRNEHGKPFVEGVHFNISHSGNKLCMAFHTSPIGVDIQQCLTKNSISKLAAHIMCPQQLQHFTDNGCRPQEFYTCWCISEALVKYYGESIWKAQTYPFILHHHGIEFLFEQAPDVELFRPAEGYCGALAYKHTACRHHAQGVE